MPNFGQKPNFGTHAPAVVEKPKPAFSIDTDVVPPPPPAPEAPKAVIGPIPRPKPALRVWAPPAEGFKPNVDQVVAVVRNYLRSMADASMPDPKSDDWEEQAQHNRKQLEEDLAMLGLRDVIEFDSI